MDDQDWKISVEKSLTSMKKDIEYIKLLLNGDEKNLEDKILTNRWLIGGMFVCILALSTTIMSKL